MPVASFLITLREALEAALILSIIAAYLRKVGHPEASRYLYLGIASATLASVCFAWVLQTLYGGLFGAYESLFEGTAALVASGFLTYMIFWMTKNARNIKGELERRLELALSTGQLLGVAAIAFITVFREGIETVLFLTAIFFADPSGTTLGFMLGIVAVGALSLLITKSTFRLNLRSFFKYTSMMLLLFAAGLIGFASHELAETAETMGLNLGPLGEKAFSVNVAASSMLNEKGSLGSLLSTLLGYTLSPESVRLAAYLGYWFVIGGYLIFAYHSFSIETVSSA